MKKGLLTALMLVGIVGSASAQHDDLYFVPKKKKAKTEAVAKAAGETAAVKAESTGDKLSAKTVTKGLQMDEDAYNRRGSYVTEQGDAVAEFAMADEGFVLITEEGDTVWMNTDTLKLARVQEDEGWVNGFDGSDSDYEYAMRIIRFRNPRYAIPVSSPLYWDVVYGGALWPSWDWNIYDDGLYAYVFPTASNWHYWDYRMSYPFGWSPWGGHWNHHWGWHYGHHWAHHWGGFYGSIWYDPWYDPYFYGYHPGWHHHHGHHGFYSGFGHGKPSWGGGKPGSRLIENTRHATVASTRRGTQDNNVVSRGTTSATRRGSSVTRTDNGSTRSSSVRVVTGRSGSSTSRSSGAVRSSSSRGGNDEVLRRGGSTSSSISRGATTGSSSRSSYTRQSSSRGGSSSSYNRPSSTRSSSSSISRSSSSSRSNSYSSGSSSSSRSSSYSSGSSSRSSSSYSSGSSYSSSSRSSGSSYSGSSSYSGGSRSSGGSYGGGSRSGGSSSGSRR